MSNFRNQLLADVSSLCRELFVRRLARVKEQDLVSEKSKADILVLILELDHFRQLDPFPEEVSLDTSTLEQLKTALADPDHDDESGQQILLDWVKATRPVATIAADGDAVPEGAASPLNQRMIDGLAAVRSDIDKSRVRLILAGDPYDRDAYKVARNAFTLSREIYAERLRLNQIECSNEDCSRLEQLLKPAVQTADGGGFPASIQAVADFIEERIFPDAAVG